jgi:hypothetical protein
MSDVAAATSTEPEVTPFAFTLVHPVLYAQTIVVQAPDYNAALPLAQAHCTGTTWSIQRARNLSTGAYITNA